MSSLSLAASTRLRAACLATMLVGCGQAQLDGWAIGRSERDLRVELHADYAGSGRAIFRSNAGIESIVPWADAKAEGQRLAQNGFAVTELQAYGADGVAASSNDLLTAARQLPNGTPSLNKLIAGEPSDWAAATHLRATPFVVRGSPLGRKTAIFAVAVVTLLLLWRILHYKDPTTITTYAPQRRQGTSATAPPLAGDPAQQPTAEPPPPPDTTSPQGGETPVAAVPAAPGVARVPPSLDPGGDSGCIAFIKPQSSLAALQDNFIVFQNKLSTAGCNVQLASHYILLRISADSALATLDGSAHAPLLPFWVSGCPNAADYAGAIFPNGFIMYGALFRQWWASPTPGAQYGVPVETFNTPDLTKTKQQMCTLASPSRAVYLESTGAPTGNVPWATTGDSSAGDGIVTCGTAGDCLQLQ